jgi:glycosyltransferase involved in cell wall biosynthesis
MKVAYVVSLFPKISETFILREMQALRRLGAEVLVVSLKNRREEIVHPGAEAFLADTIYVGAPGAAAGALLGRALARPLRTSSVLGRVVAGCLTTRPSDLAKSLPLVAAASRVAKILRAAGADRVHAHWATYPGLVAWAVRRLEGIPYSMTAHAHDIFGPNPLLERKILDSDFTVTISEFNRRTLARACGEEALKRIRVIRCGVPLGEYAVRPSAPSGPFRIVSIGRLVDYKGFPTLLRAVADLRGRGRDVLCDIVGDGPLEPLLRLAIREQGLDGSVRLTGPKTLEEVRALLSGASACVLACERGAGGLMDGIPVVLMEAMALGVPAVSTRISGLPELIEDGRTGLLATPGDPRSLAEAIDLVLSDPGLAANLAGAARRKIEDHFDADRNAGALLHLMTSASAEKRR